MSRWTILIAFGVFISSMSQVLLKISSLEKHKNIVFEYLNLKVIIGYLMFTLAISISMIGLKNGVDLKEIPILESLGYVYITIFSKLVFKEDFSKVKILGILLIVLGIIIFYI